MGLLLLNNFYHSIMNHVYVRAQLVAGARDLPTLFLFILQVFKHFRLILRHYFQFIQSPELGESHCFVLIEDRKLLLPLFDRRMVEFFLVRCCCNEFDFINKFRIVAIFWHRSTFEGIDFLGEVEGRLAIFVEARFFGEHFRVIFPQFDRPFTFLRRFHGVLQTTLAAHGADCWS